VVTPFNFVQKLYDSRRPEYCSNKSYIYGYYSNIQNYIAIGGRVYVNSPMCSLEISCSADIYSSHQSCVPEGGGGSFIYSDYLKTCIISVNIVLPHYTISENLFTLSVNRYKSILAAFHTHTAWRGHNNQFSARDCCGTLHLPFPNAYEAVNIDRGFCMCVRRFLKAP
jgi:hypothetical protein